MREAAYQAGVGSHSNPEQVVIALEPEAASVYCRGRKMRDFVSESGNNEASVSDTIAHADVKYVVVDSGGGTMDVTVYQIQMNGTIRELHKVTGGPHGGDKVNEQFRAHLESIFSANFIKNYSQKSPIDWLCLMNDFEVKKRGKRAC